MELKPIYFHPETKTFSQERKHPDMFMICEFATENEYKIYKMYVSSKREKITLSKCEQWLSEIRRFTSTLSVYKYSIELNK